MCILSRIFFCCVYFKSQFTLLVKVEINGLMNFSGVICTSRVSDKASLLW